MVVKYIFIDGEREELNWLIYLDFSFFVVQTLNLQQGRSLRSSSSQIYE